MIIASHVGKVLGMQLVYNFICVNGDGFYIKVISTSLSLIFATRDHIRYITCVPFIKAVYLQTNWVFFDKSHNLKTKKKFDFFKCE